MRRALFLFTFLFLLSLPVSGAPKKMIPANSNSDDMLPNIFIYTIPDDDEPLSDNEIKDAPESAYVTPVESAEEEIILEQDIVPVASVLKGYTKYKEDSEIIHIKDHKDDFVLNIKTPQRIASQSLNFGVTTAKPAYRYIDEEYLIAPGSIKSSSKVGNFTLGAQYNNEVDNIAMLETETGLFTKYEKNKFALSSSFTQSLNTTYAQDYSTFSLTPELKLNNYMSLKNVFSADVTRNRQSSKLVFLLSPFKKDKDRMQFELGAKQTYYQESETTSTQFSFSTMFKL